ncbi:MAG: ParB/RepB/Spo0J family partition protein [Chitinispirillia bacterium]|nr:ParB/RepB/Spo0J family partition protein [Chitinispirillia bacterium]MCL2241339.1 ParB/RepB/Spo0J family partition protein [Chitinispirillia bacterium]
MNKKTAKKQTSAPVEKVGPAKEIPGVEKFVAARAKAAGKRGIKPADGDHPNRRYDAAVPLHHIRVGDNIRRRPITLEADPKLADLVTDIKANGILEPVLLNQPKKGAEKYDLIAGFRRYTAAPLADLAVVPCIIYEGLTADQVKDVQYAENAHRLDLLPSEEAEWYRFLYEERNQTVEEIALRTGKSPKHISRYIKLAKLPAEVLGKIDSGEILIGKAEKLASLPEPVIKEITSEGGRGSYQLEADNYSAKEFEAVVTQIYFESLDKVKFDKTKVYKSGKKTYPACVDSDGNSTCPDRGRQLEMFEEYNDCGTCPNKDCYSAKVALVDAVERKRKEKIAEEKAAAKAAKNGGVSDFVLDDAMREAERTVKREWYLRKKLDAGFTSSDCNMLFDVSDYPNNKKLDALYADALKEAIGKTFAQIVKYGSCEEIIIAGVIEKVISDAAYDEDSVQYYLGITKHRHDDAIKIPELEERVKAAREKAKADIIAKEAKKEKKGK